MASFQYVSWQPDDEAVSSKLKQMADNDQWIHDNIITGELVYRNGADGSTLAGKTPGTQTMKDIVALQIPFNSVTPTSAYYVDVAYPPVFSSIPVALTSIAAPYGIEFCSVISFGGATKITVKIFRRDGAAVQIAGELQVLFAGT